MFEKEALGLQLLHKAGKVPVPEVFGFGKIGSKHYILMEHLESAIHQKNYWSGLGGALANQHQGITNAKYGLDHDNYIGKLPQANEWSDDWIDFFINSRLEPQLKLAIQNGEVGSKFAERYRRFYSKLKDLLPDEPPSLLHGDLWSGNVMTGPDGRAWIIDPAVYYGHREIELSFTKMFGGFGNDFYDAYDEAWPLQPDFDKRVEIYNIYPSMVHVNLFGQSYLGGVERVLTRYV
jgi:fructosamine-3-kinase